MVTTSDFMAMVIVQPGVIRCKVKPLSDAFAVQIEIWGGNEKRIQTAIDARRPPHLLVILTRHRPRLRELIRYLVKRAWSWIATRFR